MYAPQLQKLPHPRSSVRDDDTFLSFRGMVYRQAQGTAMGSPVSVVVVNLVMEDIEERALSTFHSPPPRFWKRYIDDTCTALHPDLIEPFHSHLNSIEPCVQFTVEKESDGRLAFLDIQLVRGVDGTVTTSMYRIAAHTNQYLSFDSHHPVSHKVAVVRTLMTRADDLSSSGVERAQEEKEVTTALKENGYPSGFIHRHSCPPRPRPPADDMRPRTYVTLPYIGGLSEAIRRILRPLEIQVVFRRLTTFRQVLVHPKDPVSMKERKGVVYSIPCTARPKVYIGQTGRCLKLRLKEHDRALKNGDVAASAVAEHTWTTGHGMDLSKSTVLDCHPHTTTRCLLESWHIQSSTDNLNRERGTLLDVYTALLD